MPSISPPTPCVGKVVFQRESVSGCTPNAAATCFTVAISVLASCAAATLRPNRSPAAKVNVTRPDTNTTPPSEPSASAAIDPIGVACAGVNGNTG